MRPIDADAIRYDRLLKTDNQYEYAASRTSISAMPTIEPKKGKWLDADSRVAFFYECSECGCYLRKNKGEVLFDFGTDYNYCPNCGARMSDDWEEPEINPCRGCDDYDGRGGCKSHGGCGAERSEE